MRLKISHTTRYAFDTPVSSGMQQLRLRPKSNRHQEVLDWEMQVEGGTIEVSFTDHHQNAVDLITLDKDTEEVVVSCMGEVSLGETHGVVGRHVGPCPLWLYKRQTPLTKAGTGVKALLRSIEAETVLDRAHALMPAVLEAVAYKKGVSDTQWTAEEALSAGEGVCQDHTHVFLACAREAGWPARYVSGYLLLDGQTAQEAMHAWAEVYVPGLGWVGFDPANTVSPDERYVRVAVGLDYTDAAPVIGRILGGEGEALAVAIEVAQQ